MGNHSELRVGIIGCGYEGHVLAQAMAKIDALRVTACADPDRDAAAGVAALAGTANVFASGGELLAGSEVDAVLVATPHHVLHQIALQAIASGKHVMAEKPIAMNERQAVRIEQAVSDADVCFMSGYSLRFFAAHRKVFDLLAAGAVGEIQSVVAGMGARPFSGWGADPAAGGGALLFLGSHLVDTVLWFVNDELVEVHADVRHRSDTGADETATFQMRFAGGSVAQCLVTQAAGHWFDYVSLYGREGSISLVSRQWLQCAVTVVSNAIPEYAHPATIRPLFTDQPLMMMLVPELEEFADAIKENRRPSVTASDGRRVLRVLDAVVTSGKSGRPVSLL
jgi:predicted dehydrogenase